jgi:hypothetical protein
MKALQKDAQFTEREFRLGFVMCTEHTWRNGKGWAKDLTDIADSVTGGYSDVRLRAALSKLCRHGYLTETYRRSTGPGLSARGAWDLRMPNTDTPALQCSDNTDTPAREHRNGSVRTPIRQRANTDTPAYAAKVSHQPKGDLQGTSAGISQGTSQGVERWCKECDKPVGDDFIERERKVFCSEHCHQEHANTPPF